MEIPGSLDCKIPYDLSSHTAAPLRVHAECRLEGSPDDVWARIADHEHLGDFVPLVGKVVVDRSGEGGGRVCSLTGMGKLHERFLVWDPPHGYVYAAAGPLVPTRDHVGAFHVGAAPTGGTLLVWQQHFRATRSPMGLVFPWVMRRIMRRSLLNLRRQFGGADPRVRKIS